MDFTMVLITVFSVALAATMSVVAWRIVNEERRRSEARIAELAGDIYDAPEAEPIALAADMFSAVRPVPERSRLGMAAIAGIFVVVTLTTTALVLNRQGSHSASANPPVSQASLELIALDDELDAGKLTVHGIVRRPAGGPAAARLTAVVLMFNTDGAFVASGRTEVDTTALEAGREGTFAVTVPGAGDVSRYRVSFRSDDHVVPHVDRRESSRS